MAAVTKRSWRAALDELAGACGDLGTLIPYALGAVTIGGMSALGVFLGFGAFLIASGLFYGLPIAVQPMKVLAAVLIAGDLTPAEVALSGVLIGAILLIGGLTGLIGRLARVIPRSVTAGLQLGLGAVMVAIGLAMVLETPAIGLALLALLLALSAIRGIPAALIVLAIGVAIGIACGGAPSPAPQAPALAPSLGPVDLWRVIGEALLPQLGLTLTNAIIVTVAVARDLFPAASHRTTERNLAVTTGLANVFLAPLGAMPMCHGAGGLQAQYRFGARSGAAPVTLGVVLIALAVLYGGGLAGLLALIPAGALGALLVVAGTDLALSPRLFDARSDCRPVIAITALATVAVNPAAGLAAGWAVEAVRSALLRRRAARPSRSG